MKNKNTLSVDEQLAALDAKRNALLESKKKVEETRINNLAAQIDGLPKIFGVDSLDAVSALIARRKKGTLGSLNPNATRTRVEVDEVTKAKAIENMRNGTEQPSQVVARLGVHAQTVHNWRKEAGLVKARTPAAEQTPAPAVPAAATA